MVNIFSTAVAAFLALSAASVESKTRSNHRRSRLSRESSPRSKKASSDPEAIKISTETARQKLKNTKNRTFVPFLPGRKESWGESIHDVTVDPDDIINGQVLEEGLYPFLVSLTYPSGTHVCGGTLISPRVVLSAAHCFNLFTSVEFVDLNRYDLTDDTGVISVRICQTESGCPDDQARVFTHPDFDVATLRDADIALVILPEPISSYGLDITPVRLNADPNFPVSQGDIQETFGWGYTSWDPPVSTNVPMIADLEYVPNNVCGSSYSGFTQITDNMLCAFDPAQTTCVGDQGTPIISNTPDGPVQVGIFSFNFCIELPNGELDCCPVGDDVKPPVFARVSAGYPWILETICENLDDCDGFTASPTPSPTPFNNPCLTQPGTSHVKIDIFTDDWPSETSWTLVNDCTGETVLEVAEGDYDQGSTLYSQEECVPAGQSWTFTIYDSWGDGLGSPAGWYSIKYNGVEVAYGEDNGDDNFGSEASEQFGICVGDTTASPSQSPSGGDYVNPCLTLPGTSHIKIDIFTDDYPFEDNTWTLVNDCTEETVKAMPSLEIPQYDQTQFLYSHDWCLPAGQSWTFTLYDSFGDGLSDPTDGWYSINYNGDEVAYGQGDFGYEAIEQFGSCVGDTASPTPSPTPFDNPCAEPGTSHVKIDIFTDDWPSETSWNLVNYCNGETVLESPEYDQGNNLYSHEECVPEGQSWIFTITDNYGDGLCCEGGWYAVMYNGVEVAYGEGDSFDFEAIEQFGTCTGPTNSPTMTPVFPPTDATYSQGFEDNLPLDALDGWSATTTAADITLIWGPTNEKSKSGSYSMASPDLDFGDRSFQSATATYTTPADSPSGSLHFSILPSVMIPYDIVSYLVNGEIRGEIFEESDEWLDLVIELDPGEHVIDFVYTFNPFDLSSLPPNDPDREGVAYLDDVYFVPETPYPTASPTDPPTTKSPTNPPPTNPPTTKSPTNPPTTKSPSVEPPTPTSPPTMKPASKSSKKGTKSAKVSKSGKAAAIQSDMNRGMFKSMSMCMSMSETTLEFDWSD